MDFRKLGLNFSSLTSGQKYGVAFSSLMGALLLKKILFRKKKIIKRLSPTSEGRICSILITGGASGIGLATAVKFLGEGWMVGIYDLDVKDLEEKICFISPNLREILKTRLTYAKLDVVDADSCTKARDHFLKFTDGKMDALFNCAGILYLGSFDSGTLDRQKKIIQINCEGLTQMTYICLDALKNTKNSCMVSMASLSAIGAVVNCGVYASTKCFVYYLTESLRSELTRCSGVRFGDISVNFVNTPMVNSNVHGLLTDYVKRQAQTISASDVADVVFEAVHECSYYKVHFYVNGCYRTFVLNFFLRAFCPSAIQWLQERERQTDFQKTWKK